MTGVQLVALTRRFQAQQALAVDRVTLDIGAGELVALLGPSGSGKSTILRMIAGLLAPSSGDIRFDGRSVLSVPPERRGAVMVFQNPLLFPYLTVEENVAFGLKMRGVARESRRRRVAEALEQVRLGGLERRRPHELSGGQQQRVALARGLVVEPKVLLLDEPLSNLDAHLREEMRELIQSLQRQLRMTLVVVTHDQQEAVLLADRIALLFDGRLEQVALPELFYRCPATVRAARFFGGSNFVEGVMRGEQLACGLGRFRVESPSVVEGRVTWTIRPEAIELGGAGENEVRGRVRAATYGGTYARYRIAVGEQEVQVVAPARNLHRYPAGEAVTLRFPPEHIWLFPAGGHAPCSGEPKGGATP